MTCELYRHFGWVLREVGLAGGPGNARFANEASELMSLERGGGERPRRVGVTDRIDKGYPTGQVAAELVHWQPAGAQHHRVDRLDRTLLLGDHIVEVDPVVADLANVGGGPDVTLAFFKRSTNGS